MAGLDTINIRDADGNSKAIEVFLDAGSSRYIQVVRARKADTLTVSAVSVDTTVNGVVLASASDNRLRLVVYNNGTATIYIGPSGVTTSNGIPLPVGQWWVDETFSGEIRAIAASDSHNVRVADYTNA